MAVGSSLGEAWPSVVERTRGSFVYFSYAFEQDAHFCYHWLPF